jgi:hypothetical protein
MFTVIPGRAQARTRNLVLIISRFRVRGFASPRNDGDVADTLRMTPRVNP